MSLASRASLFNQGDASEPLPVSQASFAKKRPASLKAPDQQQPQQKQQPGADDSKGSRRPPSQPPPPKSPLPPKAMQTPAGEPNLQTPKGMKKEPRSPVTPAIPKRIIPQLKSTREEADVLSPEERRRLHRLQAETDKRSSIIPQLQPDREEADVLPPEERLRLYREQEADLARKVEMVNLGEEDDTLTPEERLRQYREQQDALMRAIEKEEARTRSAAAPEAEVSGTGQVDLSSYQHRTPPTPSLTGAPPVARKPSTVRSHRTASITSRQQMPTPQATTPAQQSLRSPTSPVPVPQTPAMQQQYEELLRENEALRSRAEAAEEQAVQAAKRSGSPGGKGSREVKRYKEELARKDRELRDAREDLRRAERVAASGADEQLEMLRRQLRECQELLAQRDEEVAALRARLEAEADEATESAISASGDAQEVQLLNSQIWALETAVELRTKELNRLKGTVAEVLGQVERLDHELAEAMRQLLEKGSIDAQQEELAALGGPVENMVDDMKAKRTETKAKKRRGRPKKGKLARENAELKDELSDLREEMYNMKKAMAAGDPSTFLQAYQKGAEGGGGAFTIAPYGGGQLAAHASSVQAEAKANELRAQLRQRERELMNVQQTLDAARKAIVSTAGIGYENEIKLQQAKKALLCIGTGPSQTAPQTQTQAVVDRRDDGRPSTRATAAAQPPRESRSISPRRDPAKTALAWIHANPHHRPAEHRRPSSAVWEAQLHG